MKNRLFNFTNERASKTLRVIDSICGITLILLTIFSYLLGIHRFLENKLGIGDEWCNTVVGICAIILMTLEQMITYNIDKHLANNQHI